MNHDKNVVNNVNLLRKELLDAETVLDTQYSFELAEPNYVRCLQLINAAPEQHGPFVELLISMFLERVVSEEPIAVLMHVLRWPEIREWAEDQLRSLDNPIAYGRPLEKIIAAFDDQWENREIYKMFSVEPTPLSDGG
ncbi:hypothetical protein [Janthinobacterium lividum]|uniref:hypothetical protein n=1 Tax=Janthinobacterium lividum TaxID=29581 RepID=UPI00159508A5|nr:hypothetical protein [Janthinobacterium lividum]QKY12154.1 hypothetical protein G8765_30265 [Janthinobacterium lividum]